MIKPSAFPIVIDLEVKDEYDNWIIAFTCLVNSNKTLYKKMETIKTMYVLDNREYRIMFRLNSKMNTE